MDTLSGAWGLLANPVTVVVLGLLLIVVLSISKKDPKVRENVWKMLGTSMIVYCFGLCVIAHYVPSGPGMTRIISFGFGEERMANLLIGYIALGLFDIVKIFQS